MKKTVSLILCLALLVSIASIALGDTYSAVERGFGGDVSVTLTIENGKLTQVDVTGEYETNGIGSLAIENLPGKMVETNAVDVDGISGATMTSTAILKAAASALAESGVTLERAEVQKDEKTHEDETTQVVIVGAGITGMTAAMTLYDAGIDVILLEKGGIIGGAATTSAGAIWAIGAPETAAIYDFTADEIYEYFNEHAGPVYNPEVFYALANESLASKAYMEDRGVTFSATFACNPTADARFNGYFADGRGAGLMKAMCDDFYTRDIDLRLGTRMTSLIQNEDGSIAGVNVETDGQQYAVLADKVILATGGFGQNVEMTKSYVPGIEKIVTNYTIAGATGDGHKAAAEVGAQLVGEGAMGFVNQNSDMGIVQFGMPLTVNSKGEQVIAANEHYTHIYEVILEQDDAIVYCIYPADIGNYTVTGSQEVMEHHIADGSVIKADTIEELAELCGINVEAMKKTVAAHNAQCAAGESDEFNTPLSDMIPVETAPFYAVPRRSAMIGTITGVTVDGGMHVIDTDKKPIENLYAAGEMIFGNWFNNNYPMSGTGLSSCVSGARIATREIIELLK